MANRNTEEATQNAVTFRGVTVRVYQCGAGTARPFHKFSFVLNGKRTSAVRRGLSDEAARAEAMRITEQIGRAHV